MKRICQIAAIIALTAALASARVQSVMTNSDVLEMVRARLSPDLIIKSIENAKSVNFDVGAKALIVLKQAGVDDKILAAMLTRSGNQSTSSGGPQPQPTRSSGTDATTKLPNSVGVFYLRSGTYEEIPQEMGTGRMSLSRILTGPIRKQKTENKVPGKTSKVVISEGNPHFLIHLPGRDVGKLEMLSVLEVRENERVLFTVEGRVTGNINRKAVALAVEERMTGYIEVWPKEALAAGEYAIVDYEAEKIPPKVWAFTIKR